VYWNRSSPVSGGRIDSVEESDVSIKTYGPDHSGMNSAMSCLERKGNKGWTMGLQTYATAGMPCRSPQGMISGSSAQAVER
jgi:hypothetical protein